MGEPSRIRWRCFECGADRFKMRGGCRECQQCGMTFVERLGPRWEPVDGYRPMIGFDIEANIDMGRITPAPGGIRAKPGDSIDCGDL